MTLPILEFEFEDDGSSSGGASLLPARDAASYARALFDLLPPSRFWEGAIVLRRVLLAAADELARIDERIRDLAREMDPRESVELLEDWERLYQLPSSGTDAERQARILAARLLRQRFRPVDVAQTMAPVLGLDAGDVQVIERSRAFAIAADDDREIYNFYVYRDPDLSGSYSISEAQALLDDISHSHTKGKVIESVRFRCNDPRSQCNRDLLGPGR